VYDASHPANPIWLWASRRCPEATHLNRERRKVLFDAAFRRLAFRHRTLGQRVVQGLAMTAVPVTATAMVWTPRLVDWFILLGVCLGVLVIQQWQEARLLRRSLQTEMLRRHVKPAQCFRCGYNLHHSVSRHCPECGEKLLTVRDAQRMLESGGELTPSLEPASAIAVPGPAGTGWARSSWGPHPVGSHRGSQPHRPPPCADLAEVELGVAGQQEQNPFA